MRKGHLSPMHCGFPDEKRHPTDEGTVIPASSASSMYFALSEIVAAYA